MSRPDARDVALRALAGVERGGRSDRLLDDALRDSDLDERDRRLATEIVYGTLRRQRQLDRTLAPYSRRPYESLDPEVRVALRLGAYQAACLGSVPDHAALDRTVEALKRLRPRAAGTVNAVLRAWLRAGGSLAAPGRDEAERLQVPRWLLDRFRDRHGDAGADWLAATAEPPVIALRLARAAGAPEAVARALAGEGVDNEPSPWVARALRVVSGNFLASEPVRSGLAIPRSEAAQLVAGLLPTTPGRPVLDVCSGRGGKALQIADREAIPRVVALDFDARRLAEGRRAAARAGMASRLEWINADATRPLPVHERFASILVDVPCSGLGTIRRHPEIKWRITPRRLAALADLQRRILERSAGVLEPGGRLLYVTCSTEPEENEQVVAAVLATHPELRLEPLGPEGRAADLVAVDGMFRTAPGAPDLDGFFAALLVRSTDG